MAPFLSSQDTRTGSDNQCADGGARNRISYCWKHVRMDGKPLDLTVISTVVAINAFLVVVSWVSIMICGQCGYKDAL